MQRLSAEARLRLRARTLSRFSPGGFQTFAVYAAFALIAAILVGSHSIHPF